MGKSFIILVKDLSRNNSKDTDNKEKRDSFSYIKKL